MTIRVLLVDDHRIVREGLRLIVEREPDMEVVAEVADGAGAVSAAAEAEPDVVVMDLSMPALDGTEATRAILRSTPETRVLCLSMHDDPERVASVLAAGATGYLPKHGAGAELVEAVRVVADGQTYLSPTIAGGVVRDYLARLGDDSPAPRLTAREREILQLIAEGHGTKAIASRLYISPKTVGTHREHIMAKLGLSSVAELTKYAIRHGITSV